MSAGAAGPGRRSLLSVVGPGLVVAATGVGAGDLYTAGFAGQKLGLAVLWAVALGAFLKFVLNEGLARWQLATGTTLLEGCVARLGLPFQIVFGAYLLGWSLFVGAALMSACGVTLHALAPLGLDPHTGKLVYGLASSAAGVALALGGGYRLFERVMAGAVGVMFVSVVVTAARLGPDPGAMLRGLVVPSIPELSAGGLGWTVALMGGVGGTLTVICYGYWMREEGREGPEALKTTRIDLAAGYAVTMFFGLAMVVIGSRIGGEGKEIRFVVSVAQHLAGEFGPAAAWAFLAGAFAAVFTSLLGVWQSVPYVCADFVGLALREPDAVRRSRVATTSRTYRGFLVALATLPAIALEFPFRAVQQVYSVVGALFMPFLAAVLLLLCAPSRWIGARHRNRPLTNAALIATLALFVLFGWFELTSR